MMTPLQERIFNSSIPEPNSGCWLWTGAVTKDGYGRVGVCGVNRHAHRVAYEAFIAPIPEGLTIDHLCRVRCCVNPQHMEPVSLLENIRRGDQKLKGWRARITHCPKGHPYSGQNTSIVVYRGRTSRVCIACRRANRRRSEEIRRAKN